MKARDELLRANDRSLRFHGVVKDPNNVNEGITTPLLNENQMNGNILEVK
eukprot:gnl/Chilomastix_caulleri/4773.p4 GENE.gnl/Chilomastix_caulleri/4773~~gnl/Chilomastix_caulleri/4773.p4  ORF type:complete len:50 (+),score=20.57 gnl/Chilomastix_caulleri/4773:336-485(+)